MKQRHDDEIRIAAEAARWQRALENGGPQVREEFAAWVKLSPRHLQEFLFMEALDAAAGDIDPSRSIEGRPDIPIESNVVLLRDNACTVTNAAEHYSNGMREAAPKSSRFHGARRGLLAVAAALIAALGLAWWQMPDATRRWQSYSTSVGEQRSIVLPDGSVLQLNAQSQVQIRLSKGSRDIRLLDGGEALFKVSHDPARPFRVHSGNTVIRAVGTQFNVNSRSHSTKVAVIEGRVEISRSADPIAIQAPPVSSGNDSPHDAARISPNADSTSASPTLAEFGAGESAQVEHGGAIVRDNVDVSDALAWRQRRFVFREETLANIAEEFRLYNHTPQLVVVGEAARSKRYGGTFDADDLESFVQYVTKDGDLVIERAAGSIIIRSR